MDPVTIIDLQGLGTFSISQALHQARYHCKGIKMGCPVTHFILTRHFGEYRNDQKHQLSLDTVVTWD
jgi:hypothetical protein